MTSTRVPRDPAISQELRRYLDELERAVDAAANVALDADLTAIAALTGTNTIYYRSAADTWTAVTIGSGLSFSGGTLSNSSPDTNDVVLISSQVANLSATIDFTGLDDTYEAYEVRMSNIRPETDQVELRLRVGTGATPTYQADATDYYWQTQTMSGGVSAINADAADNEMVLTFAAGASALGDAAGEGLSGVVRFGNPAAAHLHNFSWMGTYRDSAGVPRPFWGGGGYETAEAITAIRFLMSADDIESGRFSLYGYVKA